MRLPTAGLVTACALAAALLVAGHGGEAGKDPAPDSEVIAPAVEGRVLLTDRLDDPFADTFDAAGSDAGPDPGPHAARDRGVEPDAPGLPVVLEPDQAVEVDPGAIGPETVPEVPDPPDGGGLIPDGPDESDILPG
ncbi:hypothetical protein [Streptomyces sp. NBC_01235]|uniref:hypothetical protein n=1 Tax=Streptomyces sp. NBC_01235 TaxID=2903788 RepID=UPI002E15E938|nr:hypothetical protein OG289_44390 [Streptomyces sp. NBC_01235]